MTIASNQFDPVGAAAGASSTSPPQDLSYSRKLFCAALVGVVGGLVATAYYFMLEQLLELVWEHGRESVLHYFPAWLPHWCRSMAAWAV